MESSVDLLSLNNPVFCSYVFWAGVLGFKMLSMALITAFNRFRYKVFANKECTKMFKNVDVQFNDPNVERVRRAHRNDMENILPFFTIALLYVSTDPNPTVAVNLFRVAGVFRIIHTFVYAFYPVPQPSRAIAFFVTFLISIYMTFHIMCCCIKYI